MFREGLGIKKAYIACGYTDLRYGIDGLASLVQKQISDMGSMAWRLLFRISLIWIRLMKAHCSSSAEEDLTG